MNSESPKQTKVTVRSDEPVAIASAKAGANMDVLAFNMSLISDSKPLLAVEILKLWKQVIELDASTPVAAGEDFARAADLMDEIYGGEIQIPPSLR